MRYTITHHGAPIGTTELRDVGSVCQGTLHPAPAFPAAATAIRAELAAQGTRPGDIHATPPGLELRDALGVFVATDYIMVLRSCDPADGKEPRHVEVRFRDAVAGVPAVPAAPTMRRDGERSRPAT